MRMVTKKNSYRVVRCRTRFGLKNRLNKSKKSSIYKKNARFSFFIWYHWYQEPCKPKQYPLAQAAFVLGAWLMAGRNVQRPNVPVQQNRKCRRDS